MPLQHFDGNVFFYQPIGEMSGGLSGVTFTIGPAGKATKVVIEDLDVHGEGTFAAVPGKKVRQVSPCLLALATSVG